MNIIHMEFNIINPKNIDKQQRNAIINQNIVSSAYEQYKMCPCVNPVKYRFTSQYDPTDDVPSHIPKVIVLDKHPLDLLISISQRGLSSLSSPKSYPVVIYPMGREFIGTNSESGEGIYDETIFLRTNYAHVIKKVSSLLPIKDEPEVIYLKYVMIIRNNNYDLVKLDDIIKMAVITTFPPDDIKHVTIDDDNVLTSTTFLKFQMVIEAAFQAAICGDHTIIVIPVFDKEFGIPIEDQLKIYNLCILKYGTKFSNIIIAISNDHDPAIVEYFEKHIIKPRDITQEIDAKHEASKMTQKLIKK